MRVADDVYGQSLRWHNGSFGKPSHSGHEPLQQADHPRRLVRMDDVHRDQPAHQPRTRVVQSQPRGFRQRDRVGVLVRWRTHTTTHNRTAYLQIGSKGDAVRSLLATLNRWYPSMTPLTVDGDFGPATKGRVVYFQQRAGLVADGIVGPRTWSALGYR
ncbi:peptidoglycan-binding domain-containing protein [Actinosynnema sp. ALI-1.44]|uniref:peptidoglycan-binding domain-containing protein n=1 Tax=Actinosynnema sp. ALI-1.44 TaxID=1933779 RepID=UPI0026C77B05|nr:peptidoglycan-binding domain-containing protein [Actinosynnema sp. ALI-1.44]